MEIQKFDHVNMTVRNLDETIRWYGRVFHFSVVEDGVRDGIRWAILQCGDQMLCVYEYPDREFVDRFELNERGIHGVNHLAFRISDEREWLRVVERERLHPDFMDYPHSRAWYVTDPTGYEIEVAYWKDGVKFDHRATA